MRPTQLVKKSVELPCRQNPDLWFSELRRDKRAAKKVCEGCPALQACKELAIESSREGKDEWGIWGGTDQEERRRAARDHATQGPVAA